MLSTSSAINISILFACLVIFLPLMLAGIHLSRHKLLFSSAALFFTLFLFIHVSHFLPFIFSPSSPSNASCITFHHSSSYSFTCNNNNNLKKVSTSNALDLLNGSSILIAGDSQARLFTLSLLDLLVVDDDVINQVRSELFRRHSDYFIQLPSHAISVNFQWAPYEANVTESLKTLKKYPDVLVVGSGLWHMLHVTNASDYGLKLREVSDLVEREGFFRNLFWLGLPELVYEMLNTEEKRMRMNENVCKMYEKEVEKSRVLRRDGGEFMLLDVGYLSRECGVKCTRDGMHYEKVVYDVAVQIMVNALLVESQQRV